MAKILHFYLFVCLCFLTHNCYSFTCNVERLNVSEKCKDHLKSYLNGLLNYETWAMQMFDATAKTHTGILTKNIYNLGHFTECLSIKADLPEDTIFGKYCLGNVRNALELFPTANVSLRHDVQSKLGFTATSPLKWGVCVPDTCNANELNEFMLELIRVNVSFAEDMCQSRNSSEGVDLGATSTKVMFALIGGLVLISSVYHLYLENTGRVAANGILMAFSALANGRKIMRTNVNTGDRLECLDGIKSIAMILTIIGHDYYIRIFGPLIADSSGWFKNHVACYTLVSSFSVDSFFVVTGVLTSYHVLKAAKKTKSFNVIGFYAHRYFSFLPGVIAMMLIHMTILKGAASGPLYQKVMENVMIKPCQKYWWSTLLFVQNYINPLSPCIPPSWYLSLDFQVCLISPIFLIPLVKRPKLAFKILGILSAFSVTVGFLVYYHYKLLIVHTPKDVMNLSTTRNNYLKYFYTSPYTRMTPYLIGIITGYLIFQLKQQNGGVHLKKKLLILLWLLYPVITVGSVIIGEILFLSKYNRLLTSLYGCLIRPVWSLTLCWVIFACTFNYGGFLNTFLSHPIFHIFSKLASSLLLVHFPILMVRYVSSKTPYSLTLFDFVINNAGNVIFIISASFLWSLIIEYPFNGVLRNLLSNSLNTEKIDSTTKNKRED